MHLNNLGTLSTEEFEKLSLDRDPPPNDQETASVTRENTRLAQGQSISASFNQSFPKYIAK